MKLIFLGPPGAGKGTIASGICDHFKIIQISTGDIFREAVKNETPLGKQVKDLMEAGNLIPDELTINLVKERLGQDDLAEGYILDGFPRTIPQAEALKGFAQIDSVINFTVPDENVIIQRLTGRRVCKACKAIFHATNNPPKTEGICDACGGELYIRKDDEITSVKQRLEVYAEQTQPLIDFYKNEGLLKDIDASLTPGEVNKNLIKVLES